MKNKMFNELLSSLKEARDIAQGKKRAKRRFVMRASKGDVRRGLKLLHKISLSQ